MKKNYIAPQTEAIEVFASQVLMASPVYINPTKGFGTGSGQGEVM